MAGVKCDIMYFVLGLIAAVGYSHGAQTQEYIVAVDNLGEVSAQTLSIKAQLNTQFKAQVQREINIGRLKFLITETTEEARVGIQNVQGVKYIEPNAIVKASLPSGFNASESNTTGFDEMLNVTTEQPITTTPTQGPTVTEELELCYEQNSGTKLWGLTRMVRRGDSWTPDDNSTPKDPVSDVYTYSSVDDGRDVEIYVLDSGVNVNHEDFGKRAVHDFTSSEIKSEGDSDRNGHGTHVAGSAGSTTYGVAKKSIIRAVKVLNAKGSGSGSSILSGMEYVHNRFNSEKSKSGKRPKMVVNMSLGAANIIKALDDALVEMARDGLIVVVAAGNDAADACTGSPANVAEAITVGATDNTDSISSFSNYGTCIDILAPGSQILSTWYDSNTATNTISGTSMATPYVAGIIARYIQKFDEPPRPEDVQDWLRNTATGGMINVNRGDSHSAITTDKLVYKECDPGPAYGPDDEVKPKEWPKYAGYAAAGAAFLAIAAVVVKMIGGRFCSEQ